MNTTENNNHCQSQEEINRVLESGYVDIALINAYFDFNDYDKPIKTYLSSTEFLFLRTNDECQQFQALIQQNEVLTSDGRLYGEPFKSENFYSVTDKVYKTLNSATVAGAKGLISIALAKETHQYERNVYTFFDMIGFLGGLYDSLFFIGFLFVYFFQTKLFNYKIISQLYQINDKPKILHKQARTEFQLRTNENRKVLNTSNDFHNEEIKEHLNDLRNKTGAKIDTTCIVPKANSDIDNSIPKPEEYTIQDDLLQELSSELKHRRSFTYTWVDLLPDFRKLLCCKKYKNIDATYQKNSNIYK